MSVIAKTFEVARSENRMAFMPFITAGDPDLDGTKSLIKELAERGVDMIEIGFPYSDPIADGPVIQESYTRALAAGIQVDDIFEAVKSLNDVPPLVAMVSYALIFRIGLESFVEKAATSGFAGLIVPDLPGDEAAEFSLVTKKHGLDLVQLVAPTSTPERTKKILETCTGFVYCIAVSGITGERTGVKPELIEHLKSLRNLTDLPLAVGFGISQPDHVDSLRDVADGVIVGSAIVRRISDSDSPIQEIGEFAATMVTAVRNG